MIRWLKRVFGGSGDAPGDDDKESGELLPPSVELVALARARPEVSRDRPAPAGKQENSPGATKPRASPPPGDLAAAVKAHEEARQALRAAFERGMSIEEPERGSQLSIAIGRFLESGVLEGDTRIRDQALSDLPFYLNQVSPVSSGGLSKVIDLRVRAPVGAFLEERRFAHAIGLIEIVNRSCGIWADWLEEARRQWRDDDGTQALPSLVEQIAWAREVEKPLHPLASTREALADLDERSPDRHWLTAPVVTSLIDLCLACGDVDALGAYDDLFRKERGSGLAPDKHLGKSFKEWCVKHAKEGRPEIALTLSEAAATRGLSDGTKGGFEARSARLAKKVRRESQS